MGQLVTGRRSHGFKWLSAVAAGALALSAVPSRAAVITLVSDDASGEDWSTGTHWSDGLPAAAGNDYFVGSGAGKIIRSTNNGTAAVFPGDSLELDATGLFRLKSATGGSVSLTLLKLNGGALHNGNASNTTTVSGAINVLSASTLDLSSEGSNLVNNGADVTRFLTIAATLSGSGLLNVGNGGTAPTAATFATLGNVNVTSTNNTFSGGWNVQSGILHGQSSGSLGTGNITVGASGGFDTDYNVSLPTKSFSLSGLMQLDQNDTFGNVSINGTPLAAGTYNFAQLSTAFPTNFVPGGTGSITVAPEPASLGIIAVSALGLLQRRRRSAVGG